MTLIDISPRISPRLGVWPGDIPPTREILADLARGDSVTLSTLRSTVHLGAHVDAPCHFSAGGPAAHELDLEPFLGPCQVMRVAAARAARLTPAALPGPVRAERVLLATGTYPDPERFSTDFAAPSVELVEKLATAGVRLLGVDTPSMDLFDSKDLAAHRACRRAGIAILEGLVLSGVPEGLYELIALPLGLEGFDASPVRAVLRSG